MRIESCWKTPLLDPLLRWTLPAIAVVGIIAARFFPFDALPPLCPLRRITGIPCLGCGGTRSWVEMTHFDPIAAFIQSPLGAVFFMATLAMIGYQWGRSLGWIPALRIHSTAREGFWLRAVLLGLITAHWAYLILSGVAT